MTGRLVRWSLKFRLIVLAAAGGILGFGLTTLPSMPVDNLPEFSPPHVEIQTEALGLSAVEVEQLITSPMEADLLNGIAWLDEIRSKSVPGLSSIEMVFETGTDILRARQLVAERLTQAFALPNVSSPPVLMQPLSSWLALAAAAGILVLLLTVLGNWRLAGLVFLLLPVALSGGILAADLGGGFGSVYVLVALAAVLALAIRDVVMLMGTYQSLQSRAPSDSPAHLMRQAAGERLLPTVLTTVITGLALVPLVLLGGPVGGGMILPLALVVWGGLITSALLTLFILPILFLRIGPRSNTDWGSSLVINNGPVLAEGSELS